MRRGRFPSAAAAIAYMLPRPERARLSNGRAGRTEEEAMPTWAVFLAAASMTLLVEGAWVWPLFAGAPPSDWASTLFSHLSLFGLLAILLFALFVMLLTTAVMIIDASRVRSRLDRSRLPTRQDWEEAFAATALSGLDTRLLDLAPHERRSSSQDISLLSRFDAAAARREIGRQFSRHLARAQFFTALGLAFAIALFGWTLKLGAHSAIPVAIPAAGIAVAALVLALLAAIGRAIVMMAAEPLLDTIAALPFERLESELMRRIGGVLLAGSADRARLPPPPSPAIEAQLVRLTESIGETRRVLVDATENLSRHAETLALAARSIAERPSESGTSDLRSSDSEALRAAIERLAESAERLATAPQDPAYPGEEAAAQRHAAAAPASELGQELRRLIAQLK